MTDTTYTEQDRDRILKRIREIGQQDLFVLDEKGKSYGASWRAWGGAGAFINMARKWDRLVVAVVAADTNIFHAYARDQREESILDDVRDLRRYLLLIEEHLTSDEFEND